jgi:hypothetical protein
MEHWFRFDVDKFIKELEAKHGKQEETKKTEVLEYATVRPLQLLQSE